VDASGAAAASAAGADHAGQGTEEVALHPPVFRRRSSTEQAVRLLGLLQELGAGARFERSVKLRPGALEPNRFILAVDKPSIRGDAEAGVLRVCEAIGMPAAGLQLFRDHFAESTVVGWGLDEDESACVVKGYLEFGDRHAETMRSSPGPDTAYVSHVGVKWDAAQPERHVLAEYRCFPALGAEDMLARIAASHYPGADGGALAVVRGVVAVASGKARTRGFPYLEVSEPGTPRASFDVNVYRAELKVSDVQPQLAATCRHFAIPPAAIAPVYATMRDAVFGHVAGGTDRDGGEFLTVYFEE
jgi:hypothetical protein